MFFKHSNPNFRKEACLLRPLFFAATWSLTLVQSGVPLPLPQVFCTRGGPPPEMNFLTVNELTLRSSSYLIWVINVLLPAFLGIQRY